MKSRTAALAFTCLVCALPALSRADLLEDRFKALDKNGDGVLSGDELDAAPFLRQLDLNHDGKVTLEEARQGMKLLGNVIKESFNPEHGPRTEDVFKMLDRNGDGKLTPDELTNPVWFKKLDLNGDGVITLAEAKQAMGEFLPKKFGKVGDKGGIFRGNTTSVPAPSNDPSVKEAPQTLKGSELSVGRQVPNLTWKSLQGGDIALTTVAQHKPLVIGLFNATCPLSAKLAPEMGRLEKEYSARGVSFLWLSVDNADLAKVRSFVAEAHLSAPVALDTEGHAVSALKASSTTETLLLDATQTLVYRGAINDQYGLGYSLETPRHSYLRDALTSVLRGDLPLISATTAPGCALDTPKTIATAQPAAVTYYRDVARILNQNCVECHRTGGIAPFTLTSYEDVIEHAGMIRKQVDRSTMPPWFAKADGSGAHSLFANDRSLSERDRADLIGWLASDRAKGNASDAPEPRHFADEWTIGKPEMILQIPHPIQVKAEGTMPYQYAVIDTQLPEDKWVQAYEIIPTARNVVHHVVITLPDGKALGGAGRGGEGFWAAYVPGNSYHIYPDGFARKLPAGSKLRLQIHYTPNGKATEDQVRIGLIFAKTPPKYEMHVAALANIKLNIPAGDANHVETMEQVLPSNMMFTGYMPHMHVRGKSFKYELITPDGKTETLLDVPRYDFNWQMGYRLAAPKFVPAGSKVKITAVFDNSTGNPANPDPGRNVRWGEQTTDEMMIGYVEHYVPVDNHLAAK